MDKFSNSTPCTVPRICVEDFFDLDSHTDIRGPSQLVHSAQITDISHISDEDVSGHGSGHYGGREDRGEAVSLMEPLLIGEGSRHRGAFTDLALELAAKSAGFRGACRPLPCRAGRSRAGDELLLQQPDRRARHTPRRYRAGAQERLQRRSRSATSNSRPRRTSRCSNGSMRAACGRPIGETASARFIGAFVNCYPRGHAVGGGPGHHERLRR